MDLFWHRRDLRIEDNRGLGAVEGTVLPVFVVDPDLLEYASAKRVAFLLEALADLRSGYQDRGGELIVVHGKPTSLVPDLAAEYDVSAVRWNRAYSGVGRQRDQRVAAALDDIGIDRGDHQDALLHEPGSVLTNEGDPYSVFSYFYQKWADLDKPDPVAVDPRVHAADPEPIPGLNELGFDRAPSEQPLATRGTAENRLESFCADGIFRYDDDRDFPARSGTSRLSPHLRFGTIGIRTVWAATERAARRASREGERDSVGEFQRQLGWREFYSHALWFTPSMISENVRSYPNPIEWWNDPEELAAWKAGRTGYPIVDAGMRQLVGEGWMHNRVRMITASFLTKDLMVDWRKGYDYFRTHLIDHDPGNDAGGWQWAASTGFDAQPYFRVFNPMTQGKRYDPDAAYITRYVPELDGVSPADIHRWHELEENRRVDLAPEYPSPIVDHQDRREAALSMFERARGE